MSFKVLRRKGHRWNHKQGLLRFVAQPEAPREETATEADQTAPLGAAATEPSMVSRLHERYALRRQDVSDLQRYRRLQPRVLDHRD